MSPSNWRERMKTIILSSLLAIGSLTYVSSGFSAPISTAISANSSQNLRRDFSNVSDAVRAQLIKARFAQRAAQRSAESVEGIITDTDGNAIEDALVSIGDQETYTDADGHYIIETVPMGVHPVEVTHPGYLHRQDEVRILPYQPRTVNLALIQKRGVHRVRADQPFTISEGRVTAIFPPNSISFMDSGAPVTGEIEVQLTPIDPLNERQLNASPAPLEAITDSGAHTMLRSVMMFDVEMFQKGRPLQVRRDRAVSVSVKLPNELPVSDGDSIPLWYQDPAKGLWTAETNYDALVVEHSDGTRTAELALPHFSTWNLDYTAAMVITMVKYETSDQNEVNNITGIRVKEIVTSGTAWSIFTPYAQTRPRGAGTTFTFFTNFPQCQTPTNYNFSTYLVFKDGSESLLNFQNITAAAGLGTTLGGTQLSSGGVCAYLKDLGAHLNESGYDCSSSRCDGSICGYNGSWINVGASTSLTGCTDRTKDYWSNGPDNTGVSNSDGSPAYDITTESFDTWQLRMIYAPAAKALKLPTDDVGYQNYYNAAAAKNKDIDADGIPNVRDNCPSTPNSSQADADKNGVGDVCEAYCYVSPSDPDRYDYDYDLDTVDDLCDNKYSKYNPSQWYSY